MPAYMINKCFFFFQEVLSVAPVQCLIPRKGNAHRKRATLYSMLSPNLAPSPNFRGKMYLIAATQKEEILRESQGRC
jgi:hypothetical protein